MAASRSTILVGVFWGCSCATFFTHQKRRQYIKKNHHKNANPVKFLMRNRDQGGPTKQKKVKQTPGKKHRVTFDAKLQSERAKNQKNAAKIHKFSSVVIGKITDLTWLILIAWRGSWLSLSWPRTSRNPSPATPAYSAQFDYSRTWSDHNLLWPILIHSCGAEFVPLDRAPCYNPSGPGSMLCSQSLRAGSRLPFSLCFACLS